MQVTVKRSIHFFLLSSFRLTTADNHPSTQKIDNPPPDNKAIWVEKKKYKNRLNQKAGWHLYVTETAKTP